MERRHLLKAAAATALAAPSLALSPKAKLLRFVPQANLANLDPIWTTLLVVRNASLLFFDTLYGIDSTFTPKPQMCEGSTVSADGLIWTLTLRSGLRFHDGEPVRGTDVVASLQRWMVRDSMGQQIAARLDQISTRDDRTVVLRLRAPYPRLLYAIGRTTPPMAFIMPERIAKTDPFRPISEYIGSGPLRFSKEAWVPGALAVFEKFAAYQPRDERADWAAGGKRVSFDRIEWRIIPDAATAAAALRANEVDWVETPNSDLIPQLRQDPALSVEIADDFGNIGDCHFNHLYPPFDDVRVRRAVLTAANQSDYMQAVTGDDRALWQESASFFTPGTPVYSSLGGEVLRQKNAEAARRMIEEAGATGAPVVLLAPQDVPIAKAQADITADLLKRIGLAPEYVAIDWGTQGARRASKEKPSQGGWNMFFTWHAGADCVNPATQSAYYTTGDKAWFGWPKSEQVQQTIEDWYAAPDLAAEKEAMGHCNAAEMAFATFLPSGHFKQYQAWRRSLSGVRKAPFPMMWDVTKA